MRGLFQKTNAYHQYALKRERTPNFGILLLYRHFWLISHISSQYYRQLTLIYKGAMSRENGVPKQKNTERQQSQLQEDGTIQQEGRAQKDQKDVITTVGGITNTLQNRNSPPTKTRTRKKFKTKFLNVLRNQPKLRIEDGLPKSYNPAETSRDKLAQMNQTKTKILNSCSESGNMYLHNQYELSDDDMSIFKYGDKQEKNKRQVVVQEREVYSGSSTSNTPATNSSVDVPERSTAACLVEGRDETDDAEYINVPNEARNAAAEKTQQFAFDVEGGRNVENLTHRQRWLRRRDRFIDWFKKCNCTRLYLGIFLVVIFGFVIISSFLPSIVDSNEKKTSIDVHERLSDYIYPTLSAIRTNLVDPDTPASAHTRKAKNGEVWDLVFSDEFNAEGRTFFPGMDQFWEGTNLNYAATKDLEWYDPDAAFTANGSLHIRMDAYEQHDLLYRSAMLQSWNKLCFSEGILEISAKLPGSAYTAGLWPGLWALGNLARPGYMASTDGVWPYTYNECDAGITANQSSFDGMSYLPGQKLNKCTCKGEAHPNRGVGRGAPEIDVLEGAHASDQSTTSFGVASQTLQIAPFDIWYQPDYDFVEVYNYSVSNIASFLGTPFQEMLSTLTTINETWFERVVDPLMPNHTLYENNNHFQKYSVEYLSKKKSRNENYCRFFVGDEPTSTIYGNALHPQGNIGWRDIPKEPMSIILNLGVSPAWSMIQWLNIVFPVTFEIDYVRIYQPKGKKSLTCDPPDFPTYDYIKQHEKAYMNPNLTNWEQAGYKYPKNKLTGC